MIFSVRSIPAYVVGSPYAFPHVILLHFSSSDLQHTFFSVLHIYVHTQRSQRGYYNILRYWELSCCRVAGAEQGIQLERDGHGKLKGRTSKRTSSVFQLLFHTALQPALSCSTVPCLALPPATPHWRSSAFTVISLCHNMVFGELLL